MTSTSADRALSARSWPIRLARVLTASCASVGLAAAGHDLAGGARPGIVTLAVILFGASAITWSLSRRRLLVGQLLGLLLIAQIAVHFAGMLSTQMAPMGVTMIGAHLAGTGITAILLARGERCLWTLADHLGLRVVAFVMAACLVPRRLRHTLRAIGTIRCLPTQLRSGGLGLRGPPISAA